MRIQIEKNFDLIKPFGPSIVKVKMPEEIVNNLNNYIDKIISDRSQSNNLNMGKNLVGDVTQEFKLEQSFVTESGWLKFLGQSVQKWIKIAMNKELKEFKILDTWVVRQFKNEYNPIHWHNGHISGAGFLKVPETLGKHFQDDKGKKKYEGGQLTLIHGSRQFMSDCRYPITPKVGDFYFFPNYLMHTVYPFKGTDDERRSVSFNAYIDNQIYNSANY